jgi:hypothetical protein
VPSHSFPRFEEYKWDGTEAVPPMNDRARQVLALQMIQVSPYPGNQLGLAFQGFYVRDSYCSSGEP